MTPREYFAHYVEQNGGPTRVAERLGIPFPTIAAVCNGQRGIGRRLAERMAQADPLLDPKTLVWVKAEPQDHPPARRGTATEGAAAEADEAVLTKRVSA